MGTIFDTKGCFYRALDDEPVFVLLARDPCAAETVRYWVTLRQALIGRGEKPLEDHETLASALRDAQTMVVWRAEATDPADDTLGGVPRWCAEKVPERRLVSAALDREVEALRARVVELEGKLQLAELTAQPKRDHPDEPQVGHMLPHDEWAGVFHNPNTMRLGNRFLIWDKDGELVFHENRHWQKPAMKADWTGWYPLRHSLQRDMLWCAYEDFRNGRPINAGWRANTTRRAIELGTKGSADALLNKDLKDLSDDDVVAYHVSTLKAAMAAAFANNDQAKAFAASYKMMASGYGSGINLSADTHKVRDALRRLSERLESEIRHSTWPVARKNRMTKIAQEIIEQSVKVQPLPFIAVDLAAKIATGLRQVTDSFDESLAAYRVHGDIYCGRHDSLESWIDRINGYAAELDDGRFIGERLQTRSVGKSPLLGMPYGEVYGEGYNLDTQKPSGVKTVRVEYDSNVETPAEILKAIADTFGISYAQMAEDYRRVHGIPDPIPSGVYWSVEAGNFYSFEGKNSFEGSRGMGHDFYIKWKDRQSEFPSKVHDEIAMPPSATERRIVETLAKEKDYLRSVMLDPSEWTGPGVGWPKEPTSDTIDVTDTPDMPPHRFTMFTKAKGWAYGRGLEINPAHIPAMLDRMDADGWHLQCVLGGVEPTKVGMLFRRAAVAAEHPQQTFLGTFYGCSMWIAKDTPDSVQKKIKNILSPSGVEMYDFTADSLGRGMQP